MKIAAAQIACALGDPAANLAKVRAFSARAQAAGADLIVLPEMVDTGYSMPVIRAHAARWNKGAVPELQAIAKTHSLAMICGVSERESDSVFNAQIFLDRTGEIIGKYRKSHLFTPAPIEEHTCFAAGCELCTVAFADLQVGLSICYDLRFPEVYRQLAVRDGATAFVISSAWPFPRVEHLRVLATARAIENQSYVVLANRVGTDAGVTFCGTSAIIDPSGAILANASTDCEELLLADVSAEAVSAVRDRMPVFAHRREELYTR